MRECDLRDLEGRPLRVLVIGRNMGNVVAWVGIKRKNKTGDKNSQNRPNINIEDHQGLKEIKSGYKVITTARKLHVYEMR